MAYNRAQIDIKNTEISASSQIGYGSTSELQERKDTTNTQTDDCLISVNDDHNHHTLTYKDEKEHTFTLELPRSIISAYIVIKTTGKWQQYSVRGKIALLTAVAMPLFVQLLATASLTANLHWKYLKIETDAEELLYNVAALMALFIYMFNDITALTNSTWYYLKTIEQKGDVLWDIDVVSGRLKNINRMKSNFKALRESTKNWSMEGAKKSIYFLEFRILIFATFVMYICLTFYGIMEMNNQIHLVYKLDVALTIFIILEVDDWANKLFILQNRLLQDTDFDVEIPINYKTAPQVAMEKKQKALYFSIFIVLFFVFIMIAMSVVYNVSETYL